MTNIRQASITDEIGIVCLELDGRRDEVKAAIKWLEKQGVNVEPVEIGADRRSLKVGSARCADGRHGAAIPVRKHKRRGEIFSAPPFALKGSGYFFCRRLTLSCAVAWASAA